MAGGSKKLLFGGIREGFLIDYNIFAVVDQIHGVSNGSIRDHGANWARSLWSGNSSES